MLILTCVSVFLQLASKITSNTLSPYAQTYWKTSYVTDQVPDYWNHGLIYIPGLPIGPKPDIFPAWLTKVEAHTTTDAETMEKETQAITTEITPITTDLIITTVTDKEETTTNTAVTSNVQNIPTSDSTSTTAQSTTSESIADDKQLNQTITEAVTPPTTEPVQLPMKAYLEEVLPVIRAIEGETSTDPFSVFFRKMIIVLATKGLDDLKYLVDQFKEYVSKLLTGGQLARLGMATNSYIATRLLVLDDYPIKALREYFGKLQLKLSLRSKELPDYVNDVFNYMDDTYDETEEEAMQAVLREAAVFPNTKNYNKVAQGFVDYVFVKPMMRIAGSSRGNVLFQMIQKAIIKHNILVATTAKTPMAYRPIRFRNRVTENSRHYRRDIKYTQKIKLQSTYNPEDISKNKEGTETVSNYYSRIESSERVNSNEVKEGRKLKNNDMKFNNKKSIRRISRKHKRNKALGRLRFKNTKQYITNRLYQHDKYYHARQHTIKSTITERYTDVINETESSDVEAVLRAKLYGNFRSVDDENPNKLTSVKNKYTTEHGNYSEAIKRLLKRSLYKAVRKLLKK